MLVFTVSWPEEPPLVCHRFVLLDLLTLELQVGLSAPSSSGPSALAAQSLCGGSFDRHHPSTHTVPSFLPGCSCRQRGDSSGSVRCRGMWRGTRVTLPQAGVPNPRAWLASPRCCLCQGPVEVGTGVLTAPHVVCTLLFPERKPIQDHVTVPFCCF